MSRNDHDDVVFVYTSEGKDVPRNVTHVQIDSSVVEIEAQAFMYRRELKEVELNEGLKTIGIEAFNGCQSLECIVVPSTVTVIGDGSFYNCTKLKSVELGEGLQSIGNHAFCDCHSLNHVKIPSSVNSIGERAFCDCHKLKSVEFCEGLKSIEGQAFYCCSSLNQFISPSTVERIGWGAFWDCIQLQEVELSSELKTIGQSTFVSCPSLVRASIPLTEAVAGAFCWCPLLRSVFVTPCLDVGKNPSFGEFLDTGCSLDELKVRFDGLPLHKLCYQQHHHIEEQNLTRLRAAVVEHCTSGNGQQDCLGMTPLHVMACSVNHDLKLYEVLVKEFPDDLVTKDKWGDFPIYYALASKAPLEILQFLFDTHSKRWGELPFDFAQVVQSFIENRGMSLELVENMIRARKASFPKLRVDWESIVDYSTNSWIPVEMFRLLTKVWISERWDTPSMQDHLIEMELKINEMPDRGTRRRRECLREIRDRVAYYELRETTTTLELSLWASKIDEGNGQSRQTCRIKCGAEIVIKGFLQFI